MDKAIAEDPDFGLGYDPILQAQDIPTYFKYSSPDINDQHAGITIFSSWDNGKHKNPILVQLKKSNDVWKITDIDIPQKQ